MNIQNIPDILLDFYKLTYFKHLHFSLKKEHFYYDDFESCLKNNFRQSETNLYLSQKNTYINEVRSRVITKDLFQLNIRPKIYLDFGYGNGKSSAHICNHYESINKFYGIENKSQVLPINVEVTSSFHSSLCSVSEKVDIISCIHTLHHLPIAEQEKNLVEIYNSLKFDGILYLVEDTWKVERVKEDFGNTDESYIRSILELNDIISNNWFYSKALICQKDYYRDFDNWLKLLLKIGFEINYKNYTGFNSERLHGVPNITIIAKKASR